MHACLLLPPGYISWTSSILLKIIPLNQHERVVPSTPHKLSGLYSFIFYLLCGLYSWNHLLLLLFIFRFPITRSARLPLPQVALQEPFLNAQANKREMSASTAGWQDNRPRGRKELRSRKPEQKGEVGIGARAYLLATGAEQPL